MSYDRVCIQRFRFPKFPSSPTWSWTNSWKKLPLGDVDGDGEIEPRVFGPIDLTNPAPPHAMDDIRRRRDEILESRTWIERYRVVLHPQFCREITPEAKTALQPDEGAPSRQSDLKYYLRSAHTCAQRALAVRDGATAASEHTCAPTLGWYLAGGWVWHLARPARGPSWEEVGLDA